jgi:hypothetical protein
VKQVNPGFKMNSLLFDNDDDDEIIIHKADVLCKSFLSLQNTGEQFNMNIPTIKTKILTAKGKSPTTNKEFF